MNLWDKKLGLLIIVALTFFACEEEPSEIPFNPENDLGIFFVEIPLENSISQVWSGNASTSFLGRLMAGRYVDPKMGLIRAQPYSDISVRLASYSRSTIQQAEFISLSMKVRVVDATGNFVEGDVQKFDLALLDEQITGEESLNTSSTFQQGEIVGSSDFSLYPDSIGLSVDAQFRRDQNNIYIYEQNFELTEEFEQFFFDSFIDAAFKGALNPDEENDVDSVSFFLDENLKGITIIPHEENKAILTYDIADTNTEIRLQYRLSGSTSNDTINATFSLNRAKAFTNLTPNETTNFSESDLAPVKNQVFTLNDNLAYYQTGSNIYPVIDMSGFKVINDTINNINIQKADLVFEGVQQVSEFINLPGPINLYSTSLDSLANGSFSNRIEYNIQTEVPRVMNFNVNENRYSTDISIYIQALIETDSDFDRLILAQDPFIRDVSVNRFQLEKDNIALRLYYSIPSNQ